MSMCLLLLRFPVPCAMAMAPLLSQYSRGVSVLSSINLRTLSKYTNVLAPAVADLSSPSLTEVDTVGCLFALLMMGTLVCRGKIRSVVSFRVMCSPLMHLRVMGQPP